MNGTTNVLVDLIALKAISNDALGGAELPRRIKLLNWGSNHSSHGGVVLDETSAALIPSNQHLLGFDRVALDFEHNTVPGSPEFDRSSEPREVAGYGTPRVIPGDGLYLDALTWTPIGHRAARNFEDLSPAVKLDSSGRVIFLHSTALTRNGAIYGLTFYSSPSKTMPTPSDSNIITLSFLAAALGLSNDANAADVSARISTLVQLEKRFNEMQQPDLSAFSSRLKSLEERSAASSSGQSLEAAACEEINRLVARFAAEGKAPLGVDGQPVTDSALRSFSVEQLKLLLSNTPPTVPLRAKAPRTDGPALDSQLKGVDRVAAAWAHLKK